MLRITLIFLIMISTWQYQPAKPFYEFGEGTAQNYTAQRLSGIKMHLSSSDHKNFKAVLFWDNKYLFGAATVCGTHSWKNDEFIDIQFTGIFDCSGIAGWPENTSSAFTADVRYFLNDNTLEGTYIIKGAGKLPYQHGAMQVSFGKVPFHLGVMGQLPCDEPELDSVPTP